MTIFLPHKSLMDNTGAQIFEFGFIWLYSTLWIQNIKSLQIILYTNEPFSNCTPSQLKIDTYVTIQIGWDGKRIAIPWTICTYAAYIFPKESQPVTSRPYSTIAKRTNRNFRTSRKNSYFLNKYCHNHKNI